MACLIEVKKTINNSIAKATQNDYWGFTKSEANKIVTFLNDLWGKIAESVQSTGSGSYRILTSNLDKAANNEYDKQVAAENRYAKDLDFFTRDDEANQTINEEGDVVIKNEQSKPKKDTFYQLNKEQITSSIKELDDSLYNQDEDVKTSIKKENTSPITLRC